MRSRFSFSLLTAALLICPQLTLRAAPAPRAVWVWEAESSTLLRRPSAARSAVKFFKARGISAVYLYTDAYADSGLLKSNPGLYRKLLRRLRKNGIQVYALLGSWPFRTHEYVLPGRRSEAAAMLWRVLAYNASSRPEERFEGVNLDIEPHMLDAWKSDRDLLLYNFLELGSELMALKGEAGSAIRLGPAIPFWLDDIALDWHGAKKPVSEHLLDVYDYAALMDYRNMAEGPDGMIALAASELEYAQKIDRPLLIGVEVTPNEVKKVSFNSLSKPAMERELALAEAAFSVKPAFAGFVIHHFGSYRAWLDRRKD